MTTAMIQELSEHPELLYRHTVDEYNQMLASGAIEEGAPFELLDGRIVRKIRNASGENPMTIGTGHATVTTRLADLNAALKPLGCYMRVQLPVSLLQYDMPEPDGLIARGTDADYMQHHPVAADVLCIIEVADASLQRDRGSKMEIYANSALPMYIIFNLTQRVVEVYTEPVKDEGRYAKLATLSLEQTIAFPTAFGQPLAVPVKQLLP